MKSSGFCSNRKINMKFEVKIMASIVHRNNRFLVVHYEHDISGKNKQKWETYRTLADAKRRKAEIEHRQELGALDVPTCKTVNDLLKEYISLYGKATWSLSVFSSNSRLIKNYISPIIGKMGSLRNIAAYPREILSAVAENPRCFPCHPEARGKGFQFCSAGDSPQNSQFAAERLQSSCQVGAYGEKSSSPCHCS